MLYIIEGIDKCGKSTFIRCLNFLEQPDGGEIIYHGQDLMQLDKKKRHEALKGVGMVFQQFNLFPHKTVVDNITMAPKLVQGMKKEEAVKIFYGLEIAKTNYFHIDVVYHYQLHLHQFCF